jgi:uncharacterized protein YbbK (DUF523 family)
MTNSSGQALSGLTLAWHGNEAMKISVRKQDVILVSACLLGIRCRYDGASKRHPGVLAFLEGRSFVPVCPEALTGLAFPRPQAEIRKGDGIQVILGKARVYLQDGADVTLAFRRGAEEAMKVARMVKPALAILKDRSPSCGVLQIYNDGKLISGMGIFAVLLEREGIRLASEKDFPLPVEREG